jgi:hypothetical protein
MMEMSDFSTGIEFRENQASTMEPVLKPVSPNQSFWNPTNWIPIFGDHIL